jgi:rhomboid family GlyGly-CTERM serine protease
MNHDAPNLVRRFRDFPLVTAALAIVACAVWSFPPAPALLQYDRDASGASWLCRLFTCHATHWTGNHLGWDVAAFLVLGATCEQASRSRFAACLLLSAFLIPFSLYVLQPGLLLYRGLSGIDSALFVLLAVSLLRDRSFNLGTSGWFAVAVALAAFVAKGVFECATGRNVFVSAAGFVPVPLAHLVGAVAGAVVGWVGPRRRAVPKRGSESELGTLTQTVRP